MSSPQMLAAAASLLLDAGKLGEYGQDGKIGVTLGDHGSLIAFKVSVIAGPYKMRLIVWKDGKVQGPELYLADDGGLKRSDEIIGHLDALAKMGAKVAIGDDDGKQTAR